MNQIHQHLSSPSASDLASGDKLDEVLSCLKGTLNQEGLVSMVRNIHHTLHDKDEGLVRRVAQLERAYQRQTGWVLGVTTIGTIVGMIIGWFIDVFHYK